MRTGVDSVDWIKHHLRSRKAFRVPGARFMKRAAVAVVLTPCNLEEVGGLSLLMIKRAEREGDPWSGHMAFPGGRMDPTDASPIAAARRECEEEIGLSLRQSAEEIGSLSELPAVAGGKIRPLVISPFVFSMPRIPPLVPNHEVDEVVFVPLSYLLNESNRETMHYRKGGVNWELPCYRYEEKLIWGLSLKMIDDLCGLWKNAL